MCTTYSTMEKTSVLSSFDLILNLQLQFTAMYHLHFQAIIVLVCILLLCNKCIYWMEEAVVVVLLRFAAEPWAAKAASQMLPLDVIEKLLTQPLDKLQELPIL